MARRHGAQHFVLVSTDKAVEPHSVMGATKRIAEMLVAVQANNGTSANGLIKCTAVRFGNVLGSRGSVVPTFARQIELGGPVTVTDRDMTRYFMDVSEAAGLIIQAASFTQGGDIFMLDMGERIRIDDLARKMIRLRGLRPGIDIPIIYTGVRPGEKLHEELAYADEETEPTEHPAVRRSIPTGNRPVDDNRVASIDTEIKGLLSLIATGDNGLLVKRVMEIASNGHISTETLVAQPGNKLASVASG
jgi:FlaA1/EpsC-like NDP-sugar epimerase